MRRLALLALVAALAGCADGEAGPEELPEAPFPPTDTGLITGGFEPGAEVPLALDGGTAVLVALEDERTRVILSGVSVQEAAIREGRCEDPGEVAYELTGEETVIEAELVDLLGGRFAIVAGGACAEIISQPED